MIEVTNLTKKYGNKTAIEKLSFEVKQGEILGLLGPNGAGKSTTMNIITGYLSATEGTVVIDGNEILDNPEAAKKSIGYLPELPPLYPDMTVIKYLEFIYDLKKVKANKKSYIPEICEFAKIEDVKGRLIKHLSKGYKQRVGIAQALIGNPPILILDEPTVGLDPKQIVEVRTLIKKLGKDHTIIISSHILSEIQAVCKRVLVINNGHIVADGKPDELADIVKGHSTIRLEVQGPRRKIQEVISAIEGVTSVSVLGEPDTGVYDFRIESRQSKDIRKILFDIMAQNGWPILNMTSEKLSLEDIFLKLTEDS